MSTFDDRMAEIAMQRQAEAATGSVIAQPEVSEGYGSALGWGCIVVSVLATILSGGTLIGVGAFGVVVGIVMLIAGAITRRGVAAMDDAGAEGDQEAVNQAAASGTGVLGGWVILGIVVSLILFFALAAAGMIAGVTL